MFTWTLLPHHVCFKINDRSDEHGLGTFLAAGNQAAIMEVSDTMEKAFQKFEPAPRRGEAPEVSESLKHFHTMGLKRSFTGSS